MKRYFLILWVAVTSALMANGALVSVNEYEYVADSVVVDLSIDLNEVELSSTETVALTPVMYKDGNEKYLPSVVLRGRSGAKSYRRAVTLNNAASLERYGNVYADNYAVIDAKDAGVVSYKYTIPYEKWMVDSEIAISSKCYSCCNTKIGDVITPEGDNLLTIDLLDVEAYEVVPQVALIKPEPVAVKRKDIQYSSSLIFRVNSTYIDPKLQNNQAELDSIDMMMKSVLADKDYTITAVNIAGYASPEGTLAANKRLSEGRAKALERILKRKFDIKGELYNVTFGGENWDALIPLVENGELTNKDEVVDIIKNVSIEDGRESKIMKLNGGNTYRYMLKNYFPKVRVVVVDVEFNVDAYDLDRIKEVIAVKPENLSLEEMYRLSETYEVESDEFTKVFLTAAMVYPNDEVALNNALVTDIKSGDIKGAAELVAKIDANSDSPVVLNSLGAYYMMAEDYVKAESLLTKAAEMGNQNAKDNLLILNRKLENIERIKAAEVLRAKIY